MPGADLPPPLILLIPYPALPFLHSTLHIRIFWPVSDPSNTGFRRQCFGTDQYMPCIHFPLGIHSSYSSSSLLCIAVTGPA